MLGNFFRCGSFLLTQFASRFQLAIAFLSSLLAQPCKAVCRGSVSNRAAQSDSVVVVHMLRNAFPGFLLGGTTLRVVFPFTKVLNLPPTFNDVLSRVCFERSHCMFALRDRGTRMWRRTQLRRIRLSVDIAFNKRFTTLRRCRLLDSVDVRLATRYRTPLVASTQRYRGRRPRFLWAFLTG